MEIILISVATLLTSAIGTIVGFGTSTILVPILSLFLPIPEVLILVGIIHWFSDVWKITLFRGGIRWELFFLFAIPGTIFSFIGALLVFALPTSKLLFFLGIFISVYSLSILAAPEIKLQKSNSNLALGGVLSGFFAGLFGIGGAIRTVFLSIYNLPKAVFLATSGLSAILIDTTRVSTYYYSGAIIDPTLFYGLIIFIPLSFFGALLGKKIVSHIPQEKFRTVIALFLLIIGVRFIFT